jgi:hypothetical protein
VGAQLASSQEGANSNELVTSTPGYKQKDWSGPKDVNPRVFMYYGAPSSNSRVRLMAMDSKTLPVISLLSNPDFR